VLPPFDYLLTADEFDTEGENIKELHNFGTFYVTAFFFHIPRTYYLLTYSMEQSPLEKLTVS
jgi:hypothetical protein